MVPTQKSSDLFVCECCNYSSSRKSQYHRHLETDKHKILQNPIFEKFQPEKIYICDCGKKYKHSSTLYAHKKKCNIKIVTDSHTESVDKDKIILMLINQNAELRKEQTDIKELILEIVKNGTINNIHNNTTNNTNNTNTNSHNKAFNLNFFLNETCKNAMNITDFVDSIKLQLSDLMEIGEIGYVEGISKIIVKNLNNLDETIRPVHKYDKMVLEVMTCDDDKNEKIVKNISKVTIIKE
jgi:hypothetical protein